MASDLQLPSVDHTLLNPNVEGLPPGRNGGEPLYLGSRIAGGGNRGISSASVEAVRGDFLLWGDVGGDIGMAGIYYSRRA